MTQTFLVDDPHAVARLDSVVSILEWTRSMPAADRKQFLGALIERSDDVQRLVGSLLSVVKDARTTSDERKRALTTIADALFLNPHEAEVREGQRLVSSEPGVPAVSSSVEPGAQNLTAQEEAFARRLREVMAAKQVSQRDLADRAGCSQPAVSQLLNRACRPQKRTILKLAEALNVDPRELWPDLDVAELLDAVAGFEQDDYTMTAAEASALAPAANKNRPKVRVRSLPSRP